MLSLQSLLQSAEFSYFLETNFRIRTQEIRVKRAYTVDSGLCLLIDKQTNPKKRMCVCSNQRLSFKQVIMSC